MILCRTFLFVLLAALLHSICAYPWGTNRFFTSEWCEVTNNFDLCDFTLKDVDAIHLYWHHVQYGTGNFSLSGHASGPFTPKIVMKDTYPHRELGYVKSDDSQRDVFHCNESTDYLDWNRQCELKTIPGSLFGVANLPGEHGSGITHMHEAAMRRYMPNGACVPIYLTEYEVLDTSVSPPRVTEVVKMSARRARIMNQCVLVYTEFY
eukprot:TRINITY_DN70709_c0_g1_i1.p1 TRINITY_DN70709_c0_g1~~TRINITY_DN70709_c0_g1_i1.p1  ORF type:complete len:207 (-),score=15.22 TRINITY_DN70709_c0_g1_i1:626-1246(-)